MSLLFLNQELNKSLNRNECYKPIELYDLLHLSNPKPKLTCFAYHFNLKQNPEEYKKTAKYIYFRLFCCEKLLEKFTEEYFYLNPISQMGIITTSNKRAEKVSDMTGKKLFVQK